MLDYIAAMRPHVVHGAAAEYLTALNVRGVRVNTIMADPPYGTGNEKSKVPQYTQSRAMAAKGWRNFQAHWDTFGGKIELETVNERPYLSITGYMAFTLAWLEAARDVLTEDGNICIWGTLAHNLHHVRYAAEALGLWPIQALHWVKTNPFPNMAGVQFTSATESMLWLRKSKKRRSYYDKSVAERFPLVGAEGKPLKNLRDYFLYPAETWIGAQDNCDHPSRKPIRLTALLLDAFTPKDREVVIVDPFGGSGTTAVAAQAVPGLHGLVIVIDRERAYAQQMSRRLAVAGYEDYTCFDLAPVSAGVLNIPAREYAIAAD